MKNLLFFAFLCCIIASCSSVKDASVLNQSFNGSLEKEIGEYKAKDWRGKMAHDRHAKPYSAFELNGKNSFINYGSQFNNAKKDFAISIWFYARDIAATPGARLVNKGLTKLGDPANSGYGIKIVEEADSQKVVFILGNGDTGEIFELEHTGIEKNKWHHVVAQRNSSLLELYVDGELRDNFTTPAFNVNTNMDFSIGALLRTPSEEKTVKNNQFFKGKMDDFVMFDKPLTAKEIQELFVK